MSNATIDQLTRINTVYVQTIREQDARIAELEAQLAAAEAKLEKTIQRTTRQLGTLAATKQRLELELAAAQERCDALRTGFTACIDTLWRYARTAARDRGESETSQLMSANEAVGHFRAALAAAQQEGK